MSNPIELFSPFLPTTYNVPEEADRINTFLVDRFSTFADVINDKKIGMHMAGTETLNGNKFFYGTSTRVRNGYQALLFIDSLPATTTTAYDLTTNPIFPIPSVNPQLIMTHVWGTASLPCTSIGAGDGDYFSFHNEGDSRITFTLSDTTLTITTTTDLSAYKGLFIFEYVRDGT